MRNRWTPGSSPGVTIWICVSAAGIEGLARSGRLLFLVVVDFGELRVDHVFLLGPASAVSSTRGRAAGVAAALLLGLLAAALSMRWFARLP